MMRGWNAARSRVVRRALLFWLVVAFVVWNGVFDVLVERGGKEYLLAEALYELGRGPHMPVHEVMGRAIGVAARTAAIWAALILLAGAGTTLAVRRATRREAASPPGAGRTAGAGGPSAVRPDPK